MRMQKIHLDDSTLLLLLLLLLLILLFGRLKGQNGAWILVLRVRVLD
jgi:hypothetical protein